MRHLWRRSGVCRLLPQPGARIRRRQHLDADAQKVVRIQIQGSIPGGIAMNGWSGTIARINLTTGAITKERTNLKDAALFLGARGLGVKIFSDEVDATVDPLSPENKLIFVPGPFSGTFAPSAGRYHVVTKGPLTDAIAGSNSGGSFGAELHYAGYDALVIEGKAAKT